MNTRLLKSSIVEIFGTQKAFASAIGWHQNKLSNLMTKKYVPTIDEVEHIRTSLGLSDERFMQIFLSEKSPNGDNGHPIKRA